MTQGVLHSPETSAPDTGNLEAALLELLGDEDATPESHFFEDLAADSLSMAAFCARTARRADLPTASIELVYKHPSVAALAAALADGEGAEPSPAPVPIEPRVDAPDPEPVSTGAYVLCGALQLLAFIAYLCLAVAAASVGYSWVDGASGVLDQYMRVVAFGAAAFVAASLFPVLVKWVLIGRWKHDQIRIWSLAYVRFWIVKTLVRTSPLTLLVSSPIYPLYLRALGARIGRDVLILSRHVPVATDLLRIGEGTVVSKDCYFNGYRARGDFIQLGSVTLGRDVHVGEMTVLDIETSMGDGSRLDHASSLHAGQAVPAAERLHGSPARARSDSWAAPVPALPVRRHRKFLYAGLQVMLLLAGLVPLTLGFVGGVVAAVSEWFPVLVSGPDALTTLGFYRDAVLASALLVLGAVLASALFVCTVPRLFARSVTPEEAHPLFGLRYALQRLVATTTNSRLLTWLFGDSSAVVFYLRALGYDLSRVEQTGSNFGLDVKHENPYLTSVGAGTMVADGLSVLNAEYFSSSFRVSPARIGARCFAGNFVAYPHNASTGDNCLLGTKVSIPTGGVVREGVGLLGSPSFEIPRTVERDRRLALEAPGELAGHLAAKNRHNAVTACLYLARLMILVLISVLAIAALGVIGVARVPAIALATLGAVALGQTWLVLAERASSRFRPLTPTNCSIYDLGFWRQERYWKLSTQPRILDGTPFKSVVLRLLGVQIGKRVFDDGCAITDKTLVEIGDGCALNQGSVIQSHSQEDGAFKSDWISIGRGCSLGTGSLTHYGVTMGDKADLAPDSFLMKGTEVPSGARWGGNPAWEMRPGSDLPAAQARPAAQNGSASEAEVPTPVIRWTRDPVPGSDNFEAAVPARTVDGLRSVAGELGVPVGQLVLAAHLKVLGALAGEDEVVTCCTKADSGASQALRVSIGDGSWRDLAERAGRANVVPESVECVIDPSGGLRALAPGTVLAIGYSEELDGTNLTVAHDTSALDRAAAERISGYHLKALEHLASDPNGRHRHAALLSEQEVDFQLHAIAGPRRQAPGMLFHELFEKRAAASPDSIAAVRGEERLTYAELNDRANAIGRLLLDRGLEREGVVAVASERTLGWMSAVIGVLKAGGVYLPIEPGLPADRIEAMLARSGCSLLVAENEASEGVGRALGALPEVEKVSLADAFSEPPREGNLGVEVSPRDVAYIFFTSGSSGEPKGAMCEHAGLVNHLYAKIDDLEICEEDVVAQTAPQCFDISLWQLVAGLLVGGRTLIVEQEAILDVERFFATIGTGGVSVLQVVPSYLGLLLDDLEGGGREVPRLRIVSVTGEALTAELARRWFSSQPDIPLVNAYGLTETSDDTNHEVLVRAPEGDRIALGPLVRNVDAYVVDEELNLVPLGAPGEIVFSGVCVGRGYVNDPERTSAAFMADPYREGERLYRSGDQGRWRADGKLEFLGRRDSQVKIRGFRIEIGEIDNALARVPGVVTGAAVVAERSPSKKRIVAFYTAPEKLPGDEIAERLAEFLPDYMVPSAFHHRERLPLTPNGKVDAKALAAEAAA